jgi:hypothetical protein
MVYGNIIVKVTGFSLLPMPRDHRVMLQQQIHSTRFGGVQGAIVTYWGKRAASTLLRLCYFTCTSVLQVVVAGCYRHLQPELACRPLNVVATAHKGFKQANCLFT